MKPHLEKQQQKFLIKRTDFFFFFWNGFPLCYNTHAEVRRHCMSPFSPLCEYWLRSPGLLAHQVSFFTHLAILLVHKRLGPGEMAQELGVLLNRTWVCFPASTTGSSQQSGTLAPWGANAPGFHGHLFSFAVLFVCVCVCLLALRQGFSM